MGLGRYGMVGNSRSQRMQLDYVSFLEGRSKLASDVAASANRNVSIRYKDKNADRVGINGATANYLNIQGLILREEECLPKKKHARGLK